MKPIWWLPTLGFLVGLGVAPSNPCGPQGSQAWGPCLKGLDYGAYGAMIGMIGATILDASLLAYQPTPKRERLPILLCVLGVWRYLG